MHGLVKRAIAQLRKSAEAAGRDVSPIRPAA